MKKEIVFDNNFEIDSIFRSIFINGGKKQKLRKSDILGALTAGIGLIKKILEQLIYLIFVHM